MRIVFDTNVIVSAFIARGSSFEVFEHCLVTHQNFISQHIREEVEGVLSKKFSFPSTMVKEALNLLDKLLESVEVIPIKEPVCRDPSDDPILACAKSARADCLITGDEDLLILKSFEGIKIINPSGFWRLEKSHL